MYSCTSFLQCQIADPSPQRSAELLLCFPTIVALNRNSIDVSFHFFIVPLLIFAFPDLSFPALATREWLVEIKFRKLPVSIDVRKLAMVNHHRRRMVLLLNGAEAQDSLSFAQLCFARVTTRVGLLTH